MPTQPMPPKEEETPSPHEVGTVAMDMSELLDLARTNKEAFKKKLFERWDRMKPGKQGEK